MTKYELAARDLRRAELNLERAKNKPNVPVSEIEHLKKLWVLRREIFEAMKEKNMSDEKQIEELAQETCCICRVRTNCVNTSPCTMAFTEAEGLFRDAGYRKQSWMSVGDALPALDRVSTNHLREKSIRVLCACRQKSGKVFVKEGYCEFWDDCIVWRIPGSIDTVTHWMPLPEPPKGEEHELQNTD